MNKNNIIGLRNVCSNNSILVINPTGIYRVFTPFKATCILGVEMYVIGQEVTVIAVKMSSDYKLVYIIQNRGFYHHYFLIMYIPTAT